MKQACTASLPDAQQERTQVHPGAAQAISQHVLLHALQRTLVTHGAGLLTGGACPALDALGLCAVLPGAECGHLVGELGGCGAAVPGGAGRSIGDAFGGYHRECGWRGVDVPVAEPVDAGVDVSVECMVWSLCRVGRRGPVLRRARSRQATAVAAKDGQQA